MALSSPEEFGRAMVKAMKGPPASDRRQDKLLSEAHRFFGKHLCLRQQYLVRLGSGRERLAADDDHQGNRHRRDPARLHVKHGLGSPVDEAHEASQLRHPPTSILPGSAKKEMLRLVSPQDVIDEVGRETDLPSGLLLPRMMPLNQAADRCHFSKGRLQKIGT